MKLMKSFHSGKGAVFVVLCLGWALPVQAQQPACLALVQRDPDHAFVLAEDALRLNPADHDALLCRATAAFQIGDFTNAAKDFARLAVAEPDKPEAARLYSKAGWSLMRANQPAAAGKAFAAAIKFAPKQAAYWQDHATALMQAEQYWDARRELDYALQLAPRDAALWALRADCWLKLGTPARARSDARQALALQPEQPMALAIIQKVAVEE
jgi:Flp pilus assembly protein TadD